MTNCFTIEPYWAESNYIKWSKAELTKTGLPDSDIQALCEQGIPEWVAPNLYFEKNEVNSQHLKLGEDREDRSIYLCLEKHNIVVDTLSQLMNSSATQLRRSLQLYAVMIEGAILISENAVIDNNIDDDLIDKFENELAKIDIKSLSIGTFWFEEIKRLRNHKQD